MPSDARVPLAPRHPGTTVVGNDAQHPMTGQHFQHRVNIASEPPLFGCENNRSKGGNAVRGARTRAKLVDGESPRAILASCLAT